MTEPGRSTSLVVAASSVGTAFEWYDFFLFGTLASTISNVFTGGSETAGFVFTLGAFAAGFFVRPFGAMFFGHIGDRLGRKRAFLQTIVLMGASTTAIGLLPGLQSIGVAAPILLVLTRVVQGFAMGGEYGGAAVYVAEHAHPRAAVSSRAGSRPPPRWACCWRSAWCCVVRTSVGEQAFQQWGWRIPFLFSAVLLGLSLWIRLKLGESPEYLRMRQHVAASRAPLVEAFRGANLRRVLLALFSILLAQGAVWYTGHFYAQFFIERVLKADARLVNVLIMSGVILSCGRLCVLRLAVRPRRPQAGDAGRHGRGAAVLLPGLPCTDGGDQPRAAEGGAGLTGGGGGGSGRLPFPVRPAGTQAPAVGLRCVAHDAGGQWRAVSPRQQGR